MEGWCCTVTVHMKYIATYSLVLVTFPVFKGLDQGPRSLTSIESFLFELIKPNISIAYYVPETVGTITPYIISFISSQPPHESHYLLILQEAYRSQTFAEHNTGYTEPRLV